jgi:hypothetical protein
LTSSATSARASSSPARAASSAAAAAFIPARICPPAKIGCVTLTPATQVFAWPKGSELKAPLRPASPASGAFCSR